MNDRLHIVPEPTIRRLACTTYYDELECSQDHSRVTVGRQGNARCAYGHQWAGQRDARGRTPEPEAAP